MKAAKLQSSIKFSTKAGTLFNLSKSLKTANILPLFYFSTKDFLSNKQKIITDIKTYFESDLLIVRSSAITEDNEKESKAGHYKSILNIEKNNTQTLLKAIEEIISSYDNVDKNNEILIQPMLKDVTTSGVAFTCDIDTLSPYYIINYDEKGNTESITSGNSIDYKTFISFKQSNRQPPNPLLSKLITTLKELELLFNNTFLDIEFAFDKKNQLYIFQVRPIVIYNKENLSNIDLIEPLNKIHKKINKLFTHHPNLMGNKSAFGVMPDWNPAEIIGIKPKPLAISLYKELITDNIWAYQRDNYGYRNLRSHPLVLSFLGVPYIDVRVDFNSFIPKSLDENTAEKLINYYLDKLIKTPSYHDKVEFKIVHSCYYFNLPNKLTRLKDYNFSQQEIFNIQKSLLDITNTIIDPDQSLFKKDLKKIETLKEKHTNIIESHLSTIDKIYWLTEECKRYGTLPFAGIARASFIAVQLLKSLVELNIISIQEYNLYLNSLNTISKELKIDLQKYFNKQLSKNDFLSKYGHLRPGTYDILSARYDENFEHYFRKNYKYKLETDIFKFKTSQLKEIDKLIKENKLNTNSASLINFIQEAIEGREYSKFIFSKSLSKVLSLIKNYGNRLDISENNMSYLDIKTLLNLYSTLDCEDVKQTLENCINRGKKNYQYTKAIKLPALIINPDDIYAFYLENDEPNFITLKSIKAETISEKDFKNASICKKIAFIQSADPGYDFLFSYNIAGLITQYGGANSHMTIRCAELGIPAVIGAGEKNFNKWSKANIIELDCANKNVRIIS